MNNHKDAGRGIARIDYDRLNNPVRIQFTDGSVTRYVYSTAGEKLRVIHQTAVPNITVAIGSARELLPSEIQCADSTDYFLSGNHTLRNGRIDKLQFEEGYCQAAAYSGNASQDNFTFHYYDRDHLGNIRQVINAIGSTKGTVIQRMNYYPFGAEFCDGPTASNVQTRRYNGKEFDKMHGLNTYDYGARQYNPVTARWDRVDPLSEKYYAISPYTYCENNPVKFIDPEGKEKLIFFQPHVRNNDTLIQGAQKFKDDGAIHIFAHGSSQGIRPYVDLNNKGTKSEEKVHDVESFMKLLNKSETWRNRKDNEHVTIVLHGCKTGMGEESFAEKMSTSLENVTIIAPDNTLYIGKDGEVGVYYPKKDIPEKAKGLDKEEGKERSNKKGSWRVFENGKVTKSFNGDWTPKVITN